MLTNTLPYLVTRRRALALAALALASCATVEQPTNVADTVAKTPQLSTLNRLVAQAGLTETLRGTGPFTVFAPSDEAFKALPADTLAKLAADKEALRGVLTFHVLPAKVAAAQVANGNAKTVQGANVALSKSGSFVTIEDAVVQQSDIMATNGVVHIVDRVLTPPRR